jgi:hypothetical protein
MPASARCCADDHDNDGSSQSSPCVWKQKHNFLERLQLDLQDEWSCKEKKAAQLTAELRTALGTVVDDSDELIDDIQELLHTCDTLNRKNKCLTRENKELEEVHEAVAVTIRQLVIAEKNQDMWQNGAWKHERRVLKQELCDTHHELKQLKMGQEHMKIQQQQQAQVRHIDTDPVTLDKAKHLVNTTARAREVEVLLERQHMNEYVGVSNCVRDHMLRQRQQDSGGTSNNKEGIASTANTRSSTKSGLGHASAAMITNSSASRSNTGMRYPTEIQKHKTNSTGKTIKASSSSLTKSLKSFLNRHGGGGSGGGWNGKDLNQVITSNSVRSKITSSTVSGGEADEKQANHNHNGRYAMNVHDHVDHDHDHDATEKRLLDVTQHNAAARARRERMGLHKLLRYGTLGTDDRQSNIKQGGSSCNVK